METPLHTGVTVRDHIEICRRCLSKTVLLLPMFKTKTEAELQTHHSQCAAGAGLNSNTSINAEYQPNLINMGNVS